MKGYDLRTRTQRLTHRWVIYGFRRDHVGDGRIAMGYATTPEHRQAVLRWAMHRAELSSVRAKFEKSQRLVLGGPGKLIIEAVAEDHPALRCPACYDLMQAMACEIRFWRSAAGERGWAISDLEGLRSAGRVVDALSGW